MTQQTDIMPSAIRKPGWTIAGWPLRNVALAALLLLGLVWAAWATRTLLDLSKRQIVSVSLSRLVEDFVAAEARNGGTSEETSRRTATYLAAVNETLGALAKDGTTVIVSEATLGRSVPDRTDWVATQVQARLEAGNDPR
jgi:Type-F conjugative transfer system protein (TrbI_Ftype)